MNGFATNFALWQEASPAAGQVGTAWRPPGTVSVDLAPVVANRWQVRDPLRAYSEDETLQQSWIVSIQREVKHSAYDALWLNALTDGTVTTAGATSTYELNDNVTPPTFGLEFQLEDGSKRQLLGMALAHLEWTIEAGRIVSEQADFICLQNLPLTGSVRAHTTALAPSTSALQCRHFFKPGHAWTGADPTGDQVICISSQIIFQRSVDVAAFNAQGLATRHSYEDGWDILGQTRVQVPTYWAGLIQTEPAVAAWRIGPSALYIQLEVQAVAKMAGQAIAVDGQIDHLIDWQAIRSGRSLAAIRKYVQP